MGEEVKGDGKMKRQGSYFFKYLKHVEIEARNGKGTSFWRTKENKGNWRNIGRRREPEGKERNTRGKSYVELRQMSLERKLENSAEKNQLEQKRKKKRKIKNRGKKRKKRSDQKNGTREQSRLLKIAKTGENGEIGREANGGKEAQKEAENSTKISEKNEEKLDNSEKVESGKEENNQEKEESVNKEKSVKLTENCSIDQNEETENAEIQILVKSGEGAQKREKPEEHEIKKEAPQMSKEDENELRNFLCKMNLRKMLKNKIREFKYQVNEKKFGNSNSEES